MRHTQTYIFILKLKLKCQFKNVHQHTTTLAKNYMVSLHGEFRLDRQDAEGSVL